MIYSLSSGGITGWNYFPLQSSEQSCHSVISDENFQGETNLFRYVALIKIEKEKEKPVRLVRRLCGATGLEVGGESVAK